MRLSPKVKFLFFVFNPITLQLFLVHNEIKSGYNKKFVTENNYFVPFLKIITTYLMNISEMIFSL